MGSNAQETRDMLAGGTGTPAVKRPRMISKACVYALVFFPHKLYASCSEKANTRQLRGLQGEKGKMRQRSAEV